MIDNNKDMSLRKFLALTLAFVQEIRFEISPLKENNKYINGFWVPHRIIVDNKGDCNSKGATSSVRSPELKKYLLELSLTTAFPI